MNFLYHYYYKVIMCNLIIRLYIFFKANDIYVHSDIYLY